MKLIHYANAEFSLEPKEYDQELLTWKAKPNGLWVSVQGKDDWKNWCESEEFRVENLAVSYEVKLKKNANICYLKSKEELFDFTKKYPSKTRVFDPDSDTYQLNWSEISEHYQGIIIPKYLWECRLALESSWYYGWDCASGCIWDLECIKEFKLRET